MFLLPDRKNTAFPIPFLSPLHKSTTNMIYSFMVVKEPLTLHSLNTITTPLGGALLLWLLCQSHQGVSPHYLSMMGAFNGTLSLSSIFILVNQRVILPTLPSILPLITALLDFSLSALPGIGRAGREVKQQCQGTFIFTVQGNFERPKRLRVHQYFSEEI